MAYHVYAKSSSAAFGVIVETAQEARVKAAQFAEDGHLEVVFKDLLGNILTQAEINALADGDGS